MHFKKMYLNVRWWCVSSIFPNGLDLCYITLDSGGESRDQIFLRLLEEKSGSRQGCGPTSCGWDS